MQGSINILKNIEGCVDDTKDHALEQVDERRVRSTKDLL